MKPNFATPEPITVWNHFFDLVATPRPSKNEGAAVDFVEAWATTLGFRSCRDKANNIVVHVPATTGSNMSPIILQSHVDIVSVTKEGNTVGADASNGKIPLARGDFDPSNEKTLIPNPNGDWINSPYTTLGADNGMGVAMMMAAAERSHRPIALELLFTTDEEQGMTGAIGMEPDKLGLSGKYLVNIDTEDDDEITIGAAGGRDVDLSFPATWESAGDASFYTIRLDGLKGGHSGVEINQGRGNANRLLARILQRVSDSVALRLAEWKGGSRRNAIPDKSTAVIAIQKTDLPKVQSACDGILAELNRLYANRDNSLHLEIAATQPAQNVALTLSSSSTFVQILQAIPTGICEMTPEISGLVEASCNMAIIELLSGQAGKVTCSVRGTTPEALNDVTASILAVTQLTSSSVKIADGYPGWKPHLDSPLLKAAINTYTEMFGESPKVHAIHAGLECGLLIERMPGLHAISIGPTIKGNHAVGERVSISSVAKSYDYLVKVLDALSST
ncbi:MAG: beta-Ala-His dipeptidase [Pirellula sp.]|jgi:dipeptidase D|nr:beta-Ala-His dipeptidase [Pirellula sp.]